MPEQRSRVSASGLVPLQLAGKIVLGIALALGKLSKINIGHELGFHVVERFLQGFDKLVEVFLIQKQLLLFVGKAVTLCQSAAFSDGQKIVVGTGRFHVEEVRPFTRPYAF